MGLSTEGISHQIASSLITFKIKKLGTINDCKVVINHLIRKFGEPLEKEGLQKTYYSKNISSNTKIIKDHLFPVNKIMDHFLALELSNPLLELSKDIKKYLYQNLIIVHLTEAEHAILNSKGYQKNMPDEYDDPDSKFYNDIWARYKCSEIYENIIIDKNS